jgi:FAD/FMN-containing dehydrogenase
MNTPEQILDAIKDAVGPNGWTDDKDKIEAHVTEWRGLWRGSCDLVVSPADTSEVRSVIELCYKASVPVTPQGGNTGLVGASVPNGGIVLYLGRLNKIRDIDIDNNTLTVEAGCILADIQTAAENNGRLFPLSLGAEKICQIGGNISTNAGGVKVLRYGNARDLVLGLEAVLPDGRIWNGLRTLRKNNTGYDIKHLFIGAEGTLGVITAAVLKLFPRSSETGTALASMKSAGKALELFQRAEAEAGDSLSGFELLNRMSMGIAIDHSPKMNYPFKDLHDWYALIELSSSSKTNKTFETILSGAIKDDIVDEAVIAYSASQTTNLWNIRNAVPLYQSALGASIKHDISVPISKIPVFLNHASEVVKVKMPGIRVVAFGHLGDGNIHFNLTQPKSMEADAFLAERSHINQLVYDIVDNLGGSFSAEHGIGSLKRNEMKRYCSKTELEIMQTLKKNLDPKGIMNPQKII